METEEYEPHKLPIIQGDVIVVEVNGALVPGPDGRAQWFIATEDMRPGKSVGLTLFKGPHSGHYARRVSVSDVVM